MFFAAVILATQTITLDPLSGIWFPPAGRRDDYLEGRRSYAGDLKIAFADPKVMTSVCRAVADAPRPGPEADARLRQMRTMLNMACAASMWIERERPAAEARKAANDAAFASQFEDAAVFVASIPPAQRKVKVQEVFNEIDAMTEAGPAHLAAIVRAIALRPQDARGAWLLLRAGIDAKMSSSELAAYVERLYRTRAQAIGQEAPDWEDGLREVLIYVGKDEEALRLTKSKHDGSDYDRMLLAFLEQISGAPGAIDAAFLNCADTQFCRRVVWSLATRTARIRGQLTPPAVAPIVEEAASWYADDWPVRLETVRILATLDHVRARKALTAMYTSPDIPSGALLDALQIDGVISFEEKDHLRSIALGDCWLTMRGVKLQPLPPDAWSRLAAMEEPQKGAGSGCSERKEPESVILSDCTTTTLRARLDRAMYIRDWPLARESVEMLLSHTIATGLAPGVARRSLADLAAVMLRDGNPEDAARIVRYLDRQPLNALVKFVLDDFREQLPKSDEVTLDPWDRAANAPATRLPHLCGG